MEDETYSTYEMTDVEDFIAQNYNIMKENRIFIIDKDRFIEYPILYNKLIKNSIDLGLGGEVTNTNIAFFLEMDNESIQNSTNIDDLFKLLNDKNYVDSVKFPLSINYSITFKRFFAVFPKEIFPMPILEKYIVFLNMLYKNDIDYMISMEYNIYEILNMMINVIIKADFKWKDYVYIMQIKEEESRTNIIRRNVENVSILTKRYTAERNCKLYFKIGWRLLEYLKNLTKLKEYTQGYLQILDNPAWGDSRYKLILDNKTLIHSDDHFSSNNYKDKTIVFLTYPEKNYLPFGRDISFIINDRNTSVILLITYKYLFVFALTPFFGSILANSDNMCKTMLSKNIEYYLAGISVSENVPLTNNTPEEKYENFLSKLKIITIDNILSVASSYEKQNLERCYSKFFDLPIIYYSIYDIEKISGKDLPMDILFYKFNDKYCSNANFESTV